MKPPLLQPGSSVENWRRVNHTNGYDDNHSQPFGNQNHEIESMNVLKLDDYSTRFNGED